MYSSSFAVLFFHVDSWSLYLLILYYQHLSLIVSLVMNRSELARKVDGGQLAESIISFNTNYADTGLFGVYATASVSFCSMFYSARLLPVYGSTRHCLVSLRCMSICGHLFVHIHSIRI